MASSFMVRPLLGPVRPEIECEFWVGDADIHPVDLERGAVDAETDRYNLADAISDAGEGGLERLLNPGFKVFGSGGDLRNDLFSSFGNGCGRRRASVFTD